MNNAYTFSDDPNLLDRERVHRWLSEESYWAGGRMKEVQDAAISGSRNYGMYRADTGEQVAYARVVTDGATFAWLCDVFVDSSARGEGIGGKLIEQLCGQLEPLGLRRIMLATADAHGLYRKSGFREIDDPERYMWRPGVLAHVEG
jgi:GNAT superfamily N-acetyltransferase